MPNKITFFITAILALTAAICAMRLRNPVHCALSAALAFAGLAAVYLELDAQFVAFAQLLVYVGAISILALFAVLLTRGMEVGPGAAIASRSWLTGIAIAIATLAVIAGPIYASSISFNLPTDSVVAPVHSIGQDLMSRYLLPLETIGLMLTAALIGAAVIASPDLITKTARHKAPAREPQKAEPILASTT